MCFACPFVHTVILQIHICVKNYIMFDRNLMHSDTDNKADTYVRLYLLPDCSSSGKRKTKVSKDNLNPTYDETLVELFFIVSTNRGSRR